MSVIDLTQDDIDDEINDDSQIEIVSENIAPLPTHFNNSVSQQCLAGQMRASAIISETSPYYQHGTSIQVPMVLHNRAGQFELPHVDLYDTRGVLIGTLEDAVSRTIHSLLVDGHIRVVGFTDGILRGRRIATVLLSFYADRVLVEGVTGILRNSGLLVAPLPRPGGELHDFNARPQQTHTLTRLTGVRATHGPRLLTQVTTPSYNTDAIRNMLPRNMTATSTEASTSQQSQVNAVGDPNSRLAAVKETFVTQIDLPEAEQPDRVITVLKRHQRQALFFMTLRETRDADIAKPQGSAEQAILPSLWIPDRENIQYHHHTLANLMCASKPPPIRGGILADDMGLGKTLSVLSLILKVPPPERNRNQREDANGMLCSRSHPRLARKIHGSNLIICPLSTMSNWQEQVEAHIEPDSLSVCTYHGSNRKQDPYYLASYDIVLTTYSTMASEFTKQKRDSPTNTYISPLQEVSWHRVVLDEAHSIKERRTTASKAARELRAERRWCLTGTPIQNRLDDLYSLLLFMHAKPMDDLHTWNRHFASPFESYLKALEDSSSFDKRQDNGAKRVQQLMQCLCLRRMKQQTDAKTNTMLVELPPKFESMRRLELSPQERELYDNVEGMMRDKYKSMSRAGTVLTQYMHVWTLILRLRQLATHPRLWSEIKQIDMQALFEDEGTIGEQQWQQQTEASRRRRSREEVVLEEQEIEADVGKLSLWSNEVELFGQNIKCAYCEEDAVKEEDITLAQTLRPEDFPGPAVTACQHIICRRCQQKIFGVVPTTQQEEQDAIMNDTSPVTECSLCDDLLSLSDLTRISLSVLGKSIGDVSLNNNTAEQLRVPVQVQKPGLEPVKVPEQEEDEVVVEDLSINEMYSELNILCRQFTTSTKTSALMRDIDAIREKRWHLEPGFGVDPNNEIIQTRIAHLQRHPSKREKSLVFSQWTTMLDLISPVLDDRGIQYTRLDGTLSRDRRNEVIEEFRNNPEMEIMLLSLRAGGVGLNLSCANHVFLIDSFWNPSVEQQAVDRVYRLGQKHPVTVTRYFIENSVEERILKLQRHKTRIANLSLRDKTRAKHLEEEEEDPLESALAADEDHIVVPTSTNSRQRRLLDLDAILG